MGKRIEKRVKAIKKQREKSPSAHIQFEVINELIEKVIDTVDIQEKVKWARCVIRECEILDSPNIIRKHIIKCEACQDFLISRKILARIVIRGGKV